MFLTCRAFAGEWDFVEKSDNFQIAPEKNTREVNGEIIKQWSTISWFGQNSIVLQGFKLKSVRVWNQFDCENRKAKRLFIIGYSAQMKQGEMVYGNGDVSAWQNLPKNSIIESMWNDACRG